MRAPLRVLHLAGSPTDEGYRDLSVLYARGALEALADPALYDVRIAYVSPGGRWSFPATLAPADLAAAPERTFAEAVATIAAFAADAALPQLFCRRGMTDVRALLDLLEVPYLGNTPTLMAIAAEKTMAKAIVAAAGAATPPWQILRAGGTVTLPLPVVVKPSGADNSDGVRLVRAEAEVAPAIALALRFSTTALVETFVPLGREVRCGIVERDGALVTLPLEEYFVDARSRPVRRAEDKLGRQSGDLRLVAKTATESWIVPSDDPVVPAVWEAARRCYVALGCRQYGLFDFRIDPEGRPWFLEAGPYCSFAPNSVIVTMMEAAGTPLRRFFAEALAELLGLRVNPPAPDGRPMRADLSH